MKRNYARAALLAPGMTSIAVARNVFADRNAGDPRGVGEPGFTPASSESGCNTRTMAAAGGPFRGRS